MKARKYPLPYQILAHFSSENTKIMKSRLESPVKAIGRDSITGYRRHYVRSAMLDVKPLLDRRLFDIITVTLFVM